MAIGSTGGIDEDAPGLTLEEQPGDPTEGTHDLNPDPVSQRGQDEDAPGLSLEEGPSDPTGSVVDGSPPVVLGMLLSDEEVSAMRETVAQSLPLLGTILRYSVVPDSEGGQVETWTAVQQAACRVGAQPQPAESLAGDRVATSATYLIYLPFGTCVLARDRIQIGSLVYEVAGQFKYMASQIQVIVYALLIE